MSIRPLKGDPLYSYESNFIPFAKDTSGNNLGSVNAVVLSAGEHQRIQVPPDANFVVFASTGNFYMKFGDLNVVASIPTETITDGSASALNPTNRYIPGGEDPRWIGIIAPSDCIVTMEWFG